MKREKFMVRAAQVIFCLVILTVCFASARAQTTAFTYQGKLSDGANGSPSGVYNMQFAIFAADAGGAPIQTLAPLDVAVANGVFTVSLNFTAENAFDGAARYLEISVRKISDPQNPPAFTALAPRQPMTSAPYAIRAQAANAADNLSNNCVECVTDAKIAQIDGAKVSGAVANATNAANAVNAQNLGGAAASAYLLKTGGTITGNLSVGGVLSGDGSGLTNLPSSGGFQWQNVIGASVQAQTNRGYIANNDAAQVVVRLPSSPNVGDIVRVTGAGGWRVSQNANQFVVGGNFNFPNQWTPREAVRDWESIAMSADGTKIFAADQDQNGRIYVSLDGGATWTPRGNAGQWEGIACSADGTTIIAAAYGGQLHISTDSGATWTQRESARQWRGVASSADGTKLVAAVYFGQIYTSNDSGATWTPRESQRLWQSITSSADGTKLAAIEALGQIYTSTNSGATWTPRESNRSWTSIRSSSDGTKLIAAVHDGQLYISVNSGLTWTPRESLRQWKGVASSADGTRLAAVVYAGQIYTSKDSGATWTAHEENRDWYQIASSSDGSKLAAGAVDGRIYTARTETTIGTGGYLVGGQNSAVELLYVGNGKFMVLSSQGTIEHF